ncbi:MAG: hypothetical protein ACRDG7_06225 [Candidatus Limnocylindria bacterium]
MARSTGEPERSTLATSEVAGFTVLASLLAIFSDAALGHGLLWENDPYWTYWITKTFLIATVIGVGTAWLGLGVVRGAIIVAVHTLVLTIYYWTFSPIGLPSHPAWLDLEHTWVTGLPVHFGVIYLGYLAALWLWRQAPRRGLTAAASDALLALLAGIVIVVLAGGIPAVILGDFPGFTFFLVRLLLTVPFLLGLWGLAGRTWTSAVAGGIVLGLLWATYGHFLGPSGLPDAPLRIIDQAPPPASVEWMSYRELWLISLPIYVLVASGVLLAVTAFVPGDTRAGWRDGLGLGSLAAVAVVVVPPLVGLAFVPEEGTRAEVSSSGAAQIEQGAWFSGQLVEGEASLELTALDRGARVTPLPPHDTLDLTATVTHPDGTTYEIRSQQPMIDDPLGRHGMWWGVGTDAWHHGDSGIGTARLPSTLSQVAIFALAEVTAGGEPVAAGVPVHVMTIEQGPDHALELDVGDPDMPVVGLPDGHLRVTWDSFDGGVPETAKWTRYAIGAVVLAGLLLGALAATLHAPLRRIAP